MILFFPVLLQATRLHCLSHISLMLLIIMVCYFLDNTRVMVNTLLITQTPVGTPLNLAGPLSNNWVARPQGKVTGIQWKFDSVLIFQNITNFLNKLTVCQA